MSGYITERDLAHEAYMRRRARRQMAMETDDEALEAVERIAESTYDRDEPTQEELDDYYADQDAQYAAYHS